MRVSRMCLPSGSASRRRMWRRFRRAWIDWKGLPDSRPTSLHIHRCASGEVPFVHLSSIRLGENLILLSKPSKRRMRQWCIGLTVPGLTTLIQGTMREKLVLKRQNKTGFLANYKLASKILKAAEKGRGIPSLRSATDFAGESVLIKTWPRDPKVDDSDLHEIWRNETRQLYRLGGLRGAADFIAQLRTSAIDEGGYHLVLSTGQRLPLANHLARNDMLTYSNRRTVRGRRLLWANLIRIAKGLDILHMQGMLHRNLTAWSVLTDDGQEPDFQLTGFEWSMRIVGLEDGPTKQRGRMAALDGQHSFTRDWQQFGQLTVQLLELSSSKLNNLSIPSHEVADYITAAEARMIRELLQVLPADRLDGRAVISQIEKILLALDASIQSEELAFQIVFPFGTLGRISPIIREASEFQLEVDDEDAQLTFVENDLSEASVIAVRETSSVEGFRIAVRGSRLTYYLDDFRKTRDKIPSNWEMAFCSSVGISSKSSANPISLIPLSKNALLLTPLSELARSRARTKVTSWQLLRQQLMPKVEISVRDKMLRKSLVLTQMLDYVFAASDVFPVQVQSLPIENGIANEGKVKIAVRPRVDVNRDRLSKALELREPTATRLVNALLGDQVRDDRKATWVLTDEPALGERSESTTEWQFQSEQSMTSGETTYIFVGDKAPNKIGDVFLVPGDSAGRDSQLVRRLKSLAALSDHRELSNMLSDPRTRILSSHDAVVEDAGFQSLDASKQTVFRAIVETLPLFLVQGPPGVGKTRLVRELVRQALGSDSSTRLLLSAQSNYAVDHLMHEIEKILAEEDDTEAVVVRCAPPDRKDADTRFDLGQQTKAVLSGLLKSELIANASPNIRGRIARLATAYGLEGIPEGAGDSAAISVVRKTLEGLVLRSANLVFATTNSADLETLVEERNQFDWAIVEEAGKATGAELVTPMLLSPRRLMIGDHLQLPPFGEERVLGLLENPTAVKRVLEIADQMVGRSFRDATVDEIFNEMGAGTNELLPQELVKLCEEAGRNFSMFQTLIETEYARQERGDGGTPIAVPLAQQHRMHPDIAEIVSKAFYRGKLITESTARARFQDHISPVVSSNTSRLPDCPIVWVDMPWVQNQYGMKVGESYPRFVNKAEIDAVLNVLRNLSQGTVSSTPSLAVLSPYSRQVRELSQMITRSRSSLPNLESFIAASDDNNFCTTVDSFQGNEADCVIISLVRNNGYGATRSALGFLADPRRMNVLMSRAKSRLIIVGSLSFLESVLANDKPIQEQRSLEFLELMLKFFRFGSNSQGVSVVPYATLIGGKK